MPKQQRLEELTKALSEHPHSVKRLESQRDAPQQELRSRLLQKDAEELQASGASVDRPRKSVQGFEGSHNQPSSLQDAFRKLKISCPRVSIPSARVSAPEEQGHAQQWIGNKRGRSASGDSVATPVPPTPPSFSSPNEARPGQPSARRRHLATADPSSKSPSSPRSQRNGRRLG